jgi:holo-[acyl-carrier protein] synthase
MARRRTSVIVGLGIDISEVNRIQESIERYKDAFLKRVYTPAEIAYCQRHRNPYERFAARFAAKEATMKALGTGWSRGVRWVDLEVVRLRSGKPTMELRGAARQIADGLGVKTISLSITHSGNTALAQVIFES